MKDGQGLKSLERMHKFSKRGSRLGLNPNPQRDRNHSSKPPKSLAVSVYGTVPSWEDFGISEIRGSKAMPIQQCPGPINSLYLCQKIENVALLFSFLLTVPSSRFLRPDLGVLYLRVYALGFLVRGSSQHPNSLSRRDALLPRHFGEVCGKMLCHQLYQPQKNITPSVTATSPALSLCACEVDWAALASQKSR